MLIIILLQLVSCGIDMCSGHGTCTTLEHLYDFYTGNAVVGLYDSWEAKQLTACVCDIGYTGTDCAMSNKIHF